MTLSKSQHEQILPEIYTINVTITNLKKGIKLGAHRLQQLHDAGFHMETVTLNAQLVEHCIKMVLRTHETRRRILEILGKTDSYQEINLGDFEEQTLGFLIKLLTKFTGETDLTKRLWDFNKMRTDFVHTAFDGTRDIEQLDAEADKYFKSIEFPKMLIALSGGVIEIQKEIQALY